MVVRSGSAPEILNEENLEGITHVFIGGNKGRLSEILDTLKEKSGTRIVLNVVTDRTREALTSWIKNNRVSEYEEINMQVIRSGEIPENAISIYSFVV